MADAISITARTPVGTFKLTDSDLLGDSPASGPSAADLIPWEIEIASPYFGTKRITSRAGAPSPGTDLIVFLALAAVAGFAVYGIAKALR